MYKFSTDEVKVMFNGDDGSKVNCMKILSDGKRAACAYSNGSFLIWELKNSQIQHNFKKLQEGDLLCMDTSADGNLIATGGANMKLHLLNANTGKLVRSLECKLPKAKQPDSEGEMESEDAENSIESVSFARNMPLVVCATLAGDILIWDVTNYSLRNKLSSEFGFSKLIWNEINLSNFYVSSLSGCVYEYDCRNLQQIVKYEGHRAEVLDF
jgi:WD40 repeat protein